MSGYSVVMGMGKTGVACAHFLVKQGVRVRMMDNRISPPGLTAIKQIPVSYITGSFDAEQLIHADEIIISPGLSLQEPALADAIKKGIPIISEIELFARYKNAPTVGITGSNGKSTVTTLVGEMAKRAGWQVQVGGNLGTPALELLSTPAPALYVLELSSFQLETTYSLNPQAAVVLNISEDHLDRYPNLAHYIAAKQRVYQGTGLMVLNADDSQVMAMQQPHRSSLSFSLREDRGDFRVSQYQGELYLTQGEERLLQVAALRLPGAMMRANALAALALGEAVGIPMSARLEALQTFRGLPHRCVWVANQHGIDWFNDSKGTNVGASIAALQGLERPQQVILIAGGDGKGADFSPLQAVVAHHCRACILIGRDGPLIARALGSVVPLYWAHSLEEAVTQAAHLAQPGDAVLLSPACASFDMFNNYEHRGRVFEEAVHRL